MKIAYLLFLFLFLLAGVSAETTDTTSRVAFERQCAADRITSPSLAYGWRLRRWRETGHSGATPDLDALAARLAVQSRAYRDQYLALTGPRVVPPPPCAADVDDPTRRAIIEGINRAYREQDYEDALGLMRYSRNLFDAERNRWAPLVQR